MGLGTSQLFVFIILHHGSDYVSSREYFCHVPTEGWDTQLTDLKMRCQTSALELKYRQMLLEMPIFASHPSTDWKD